jgi:hypothetical protein
MKHLLLADLLPLKPQTFGQFVQRSTGLVLSVTILGITLVSCSNSTTAQVSPSSSLPVSEPSASIVAEQVEHSPVLANGDVVADLPAADLRIVSFRSPSCGCCHGWVEHMRANGFQVEDNVVEDIEAVKREHNVPAELASCHTAIANGYVIEGHIPATDVVRLLREQPEVAGIAVPGMPIGSPGMESGNIRQPYAVYTFTNDGSFAVFQEHS